MKFLSIIIFILLGACNFKPSETVKTNDMSTKTLENSILKIGYTGLFLQGENGKADRLWEDGKNINQFNKIISSSSASLHSKFLAAEMLRHFEVECDRKAYSELANAYVFALSNTSSESGNTVGLNGNLWGFLYEEDDAGYLGEQFLAFGNASVPPLISLLDNDGHILYEGSEEATIGNSYNYRVKDFAAFYLSRITKTAITFQQDLKERDNEIERFKKLLKAA